MGDCSADQKRGKMWQNCALVGEKGEDSDKVCSLMREAKDKASLPWDIVMKTECLMEEDVTAGEAVKEIITKFTKVFIANLASETVWTLFSSCPSSWRSRRSCWGSRKRRRRRRRRSGCCLPGQCLCCSARWQTWRWGREPTTSPCCCSCFPCFLTPSCDSWTQSCWSTASLSPLSRQPVRLLVKLTTQAPGNLPGGHSSFVIGEDLYSQFEVKGGDWWTF